MSHFAHSTITDESGPNSNDSMFSWDTPGTKIVDAAATEWAGLWNFNEWVRVRLDGTKPSGDALQGSRASGIVEWHSRLNLNKDANGKFQRTTGDASETLENDVGIGHVDETRPVS